MKTAIYIEDGVTQLVLTPESEYEKGIVKGFGDKLSRVQVFHGGFYDCRGGWVRQSAYREKRSMYSSTWEDKHENSSLILRIDSKEKGNHCE